MRCCVRYRFTADCPRPKTSPMQAFNLSSITACSTITTALCPTDVSLIVCVLRVRLRPAGLLQIIPNYEI